MAALLQTLRRTLRTTARGVRGLTKAALDLEPVDDELRQRRRRACADCGAATRTKRVGLYNLYVLTPTSTCSACKCNLHAKTRLASETCPHGRW